MYLVHFIYFIYFLDEAVLEELNYFSIVMQINSNN